MAKSRVKFMLADSLDTIAVRSVTLRRRGPVSSDDTAGGLVGYSRNLVEFAHSSGIVSAPYQAGGLIGINSGLSGTPTPLVA